MAEETKTKKKVDDETTPETGAKESENAQPTATDPDPATPPAAPDPNINKDVPPAPRPTVPAANVTVTVKNEDKPAKTKRLDRFLKKTGIDRADVDIVHEEQGIFGTTNGGKYKLAKNGEVITLKGPVAPVAEEE